MLSTEDGGQTVKCSRRISAVRELARPEGGYRLGGLGQIEAGTPLEICGDGSSERIIKVRLQTETFFVFGQDLEQEV